VIEFASPYLNGDSIPRQDKEPMIIFTMRESSRLLEKEMTSVVEK
jgi:hypothetical protein